MTPERIKEFQRVVEENVTCFYGFTKEELYRLGQFAEIGCSFWGAVIADWEKRLLNGDGSEEEPTGIIPMKESEGKDEG